MGTENIMRDQHSQIVGCFFLLLLVPLLQIKPSDAAEAASDSIALGASLMVTRPGFLRAVPSNWDFSI